MLLEYFYFVPNNVEIQVPCSETVISLMDLDVRPVVQEPSSSKSQPFAPPFQSLRPLLTRNQNSQPAASQIRLHSLMTSSGFPSSTVQNSAVVPLNASATRQLIVSAGQNVSAGSTSNVLKRGMASLKITIPVPARKVKTVVPVSSFSLQKFFILIVRMNFYFPMYSEI